MDVSPRLLEQFLVLTEERHFRRAAERLSMSQPPLTQAIHRLEKAVGVPLLERSTRRVTLTPAGEAFALDARQILDAQRFATERARRIASGSEGVLRLGFVGAMTYQTLPTVLRLLNRDLPKLQIHLHQNTSMDLADMVRQRRVDVALTRAPLLDPHELEVSALAAEPFICAVPAGSAFADAGSIPLEALRAELFALPSGSGMPGLAETIFSYCRRAGFEPRDGGRATSLLGFIALVAGGGCVCLLPSEIRATTIPGVAYVDLTGDSHQIQTLAVARRERSDPVVDRVLSSIGRHFGEGRLLPLDATEPR